MASITARDYIRWVPEEPFENTDTLVLTSTEQWFVDIRVYREAPTPSADKTSPSNGVDSSIQWAVGGRTESEVVGEGVTHSHWRHWVDLRTKEPEKVDDQGDMITQPDGRSLEKGHMVRPDTGKYTEYEEMWRDVEPLPLVDPPKSGPDVSHKPVVRCTVLQVHDDAIELRGQVVRLGQFCQGVIRVGDAFGLEKWEWKDGIWTKVVHSGTLTPPCEAVIHDPELAVGNEVKHDGHVWKVLEAGEL